MKISDLTPEQREKLLQLRQQKAAQQVQAQETTSVHEKATKGKVKGKKAVKAVKTQEYNPYLNARATYRSVFDRLHAAVMWRTLLIMVLGISLLASTAAYIAINSSSHFEPYVIAVDSHGIAIPTGPAARAPEASEVVITSFISQFVIDARSVSLDVAVLRRNVNAVYSHLRTNDPAHQKMSEYYQSDQGPLQRAASELVSVQVNSVLQMAPNTYQIEWVETTRDRQGFKTKPDTPMRGLVTFAQGQIGTSMEDVITNPFGLFVTDFSWSEIAG